MSTVIQPTNGRVVWYWPKGETDPKEQPRPAIVAYVHGDRMINIAWFSENGNCLQATSVPLVQEGDPKPPSNYCTWMPYQLGQARKAENPEGKVAV